MEREEARRLIQDQIDHLIATLMFEDSGTRFTPTELDEMSAYVEKLRRDLAAL